MQYIQKTIYQQYIRFKLYSNGISPFLKLYVIIYLKNIKFLQ